MKFKQPLNILLADDDKDDRLFFEKALAEIPIATHLTTVNDGEELMDYLEKNIDNLPDVIFLDLNMPRKNGYESLVEISENENLKDIAVVILSTSFPQDRNYELGTIRHLFKLKARVFIRKPRDFALLKQVILHAIAMTTESNELKYILNA
jgi:CheY-like chemotaxis protein